MAATSRPTWAIVSAGIVVNVIVAEAAFAAEIGAIAIPEGDAVRIGAAWTVDGGFAAPAPESVAEDFPKLSRRQLWLAAWRAISLTEADVLALADQMQDRAAGAELAIEIRMASSYERDHPAMDDLAALSGLPIEQFDTLWRWAATL